jgi:predicted ester cyclase
MTDETNRKLVEDYTAAWAKGDAARLEQLLDDRFKFNNPPPGLTPDKKGAIAMSQLFHKAFPDLAMRIEKTVVQGDNVAMRAIGTGTHKGEFMGIAPTNKRTETGIVSITTVRNGKVVEDVTEFDSLGLMTQLGAIPEPDARPTVTRPTIR